MPRKKGEYGLPELTLSEMASVLDVDKGELWNWIVATVKPTPNRWTEWQSDKPETPIPEKLIRLWIVSEKRRGYSTAQFQAIAARRREAIEAKNAPVVAAPAPVEEPKKKRAAGGRR
jgi:hypothetical protein